MASLATLPLTSKKAAQETRERRFVAREDWMCAQLLTQGIVIGTDAAGNVR